MFTIYLWTHQSDSLYNIVDGQVVSKTEVNVQDAVEIEQDTRTRFASSLPGGFHHLIKKTVETTHVLKRGAKIKGKTVYGLDAVFVPPSLIDQYGCIRKRSKAVRKGLGARTFRKRRSLISQWNIDSLDSVLGRTVLLGETCSQWALLHSVPQLSERKHLVECHQT